MLKTMLVSVWAILVTLGFFYLQQSETIDIGAEKAPQVILESYKTGTVSASIFNTGHPVGHFVTKVRFQLPKKAHDALQIPIEFIIEDQLFGILNSVDFQELKLLKSENLQTIAQRLEASLQTNGLKIENIMFEDTDVVLK